MQSILHSYAKAPFFGQYKNWLEEIYQQDFELLTDLCFEMLIYLMSELRIETKIYKQSDLPTSGDKQDLIINLCKHFHAEKFLFGALGRNYAEESIFQDQGIEISFQEFQATKYDQLFGEFVPNLSFLDALFNIEPEGIRENLNLSE